MNANGIAVALFVFLVFVYVPLLRLEAALDGRRARKALDRIRDAR